MPEYQKVKVVVFRAEECDSIWPLRQKLNSVTEWFQAWLANIPVEYRYEAECDIGSIGGYEDSHYATIEISYYRPETPAEWGERIAKEEADTAHHRNRDIAKLRALRAKYPEAD